jgi:hypothetical protein
MAAALPPKHPQGLNSGNSSKTKKQFIVRHRRFHLVVVTPPPTSATFVVNAQCGIDLISIFVKRYVSNLL